MKMKRDHDYSIFLSIHIENILIALNVFLNIVPINLSDQTFKCCFSVFM